MKKKICHRHDTRLRFCYLFISFVRINQDEWATKLVKMNYFLRKCNLIASETAAEVAEITVSTKDILRRGLK